MASIHKEIAVEVEPDAAWAALRNVGDAHRLFAPVLTECRLEGDVRTVRFANGMVLHEQILDVDDARRRVAYAAVDGPGMTYHHASMQVVEAGSRNLPLRLDHGLPAGRRPRQHRASDRTGRGRVQAQPGKGLTGSLAPSAL